jgi:aminopeptidase N
MAHPVRPDSYVQINNFYTATDLREGRRGRRMMQTLVGRSGFEKGMALYIERHDGQAVTCDDFAQAIADANPWSPLASSLEAFKRWYAQAGTPVLAARGRYDAPSRTYTLGFEQSTAPTPGQPAKQPFVIPVTMGLVGRSGRSIPLRLEDEAEALAGTSRTFVIDEDASSSPSSTSTSRPCPRCCADSRRRWRSSTGSATRS